MENKMDFKVFSNNQLVIPTESGLDILRCKDILRCDAEKSFCRFFMVDGSEILVKKSLTFFEPKLAEWNFLRVHKSTMINLMHVKRYLKGARSRVVLTDQSEIFIADRKKSDILQSLRLIV
ncbi:MAG: LytTR family transcriptional regulator [Bacteroidetes bacterium]|nr:LytTR family transcriptional regulator [Bacteroidota bacterium]